MRGAYTYREYKKSCRESCRYYIRCCGGTDLMGQPCVCCECQKKREPEPQPVKPPDSETVERKCTVSFKKPLADEIPILYPPFRNKDSDPFPACNSCTAFSPFLCISPKGSVKPKKSQPSCSCRRPKIVVPSGPESRSPSRSPTLLRSGKPSEKVQSKKKEQKDRSSSKDAKDSKTPPSRPPPPCCPPEPCTTCPTMSEISKELCELKGKVEHLQCEQLSDIRHQLDCLKANMPAISDLSQQLCDLKQKFDVVQNQDLCEIRQLIDCLNGKIHGLSQTIADKKECCCPTLVRKPSSTCQFCRGLHLPLLDSFRCQLAEAIGSRCLTDVLMSIYLRADNIYHVNIRDMDTGCSLGCFLVTDCGIEEARKLGVFQQILTFCVIDVRNTLPPKKYPMGITFEFHHPERQCGGSDIPDEAKRMEGKSYMARVLGVSTDKMKYIYLSGFEGYDLATFHREDTL